MKKLVPDGATLIPDNATLVFQGMIFDVYQWPQKMFDGQTATFEMLRRPDTMQVIAVKDNKLVMVNDEQPNRGPQLHFPGGRADHDGESWLHAAQRELREETGYTYKTWKMIAVYQPLIKIEQFAAWFVATDFDSEQPQQLDNGEKITVELHDFDHIRSLIFDPDYPAMSYAMPLFMKYKTLEELVAAPPFNGVEIERVR